MGFITRFRKKLLHFGKVFLISIGPYNLAHFGVAIGPSVTPGTLVIIPYSTKLEVMKEMLAIPFNFVGDLMLLT